MTDVQLWKVKRTALLHKSNKKTRALSTHCFGDSLNVAVGDATMGNDIIKNVLETSHEITKLSRTGQKWR